MLMKPYFIDLYQYEAWANQRVIQALGQAPEIPQQARAIISHLLSAQKIWYNRLSQQANHTPVWSDFPPGQWAAIHQETIEGLQAYIRSLPEEALTNQINYQNSKGLSFQTPIQEILTHLAMHSAYHRGQIVSLLKHKIDPLPVTDYIAYVREKNA